MARYSPTTSSSSTTSVAYEPAQRQQFTIHLQPGTNMTPSPPNLSPLEGPALYGFGQSAPNRLPSLPSDTSYDWRAQGPPPLVHALSPYATVPLPALGPSSSMINDILEYTPTSFIDYDLSRPVRYASLNPRRAAGHSRSLDECATGISSLTIRVPFSSRPIVIHRFGALITIHDVLADVHDRLVECASHRLLSSYPNPPFGLLHPAAPQRAAVVDEARLQDMMRALLGHRMQWAGLSPSNAEPDVWLLHVR